LNISINESAQSLSLIQTGSEQLDQEFQNEMQKLISEGPSLMELLDMIQLLIAHINKKSSSDIDSAKAELLSSTKSLNEVQHKYENQQQIVDRLNVFILINHRMIITLRI
jgi:hypothetical protein